MRKIISMIIMTMFIMMPLSVNAELCTKSAYLQLTDEASKIKVSYSLKYDENKKHYYEITISNLTKNLVLKYDAVLYDYDENINNAVLPLKFMDNVDYEFVIYGSEIHPCVEEYVATKRIKIPKYNIYSENQVCSKYKEWNLCDKYYVGEIKDDTDFYAKLETYKKTLIETETKDNEEKKKEDCFFTLFEKYYIENYYYSIPLTIIFFIGIITIIVVIKKKKSKLKV